MTKEVDWLNSDPAEEVYQKYKNTEPLKSLWAIAPTLEILPENAEIRDDAVRVVAISDTHSHVLTGLNLPKGDILIHCGDLTAHGTIEEITKVNEEFGQLSHLFQKIIVVNGNHDNCLGEVEPSQQRALGQKLLSNAHYLLDESAYYFGLKFYGSPWITPIEGGPHVFVHERGEEMNAQWATIPADTDVLITHCPPLGVLDVRKNGIREGDLALVHHSLNRVKPRYHLFGHMHGGHGVVAAPELQTTYINAAMCYYSNEIRYRPIVFDIQLPLNVTKQL